MDDLNATDLNVSESNSTNINGSDLNSSTSNDTIINDTDVNSTEINQTDENSTDLNITQTIISNDLIKYYKNESQFYVTVLDNELNPLANQSVIFNINNINYTRFSNDEGKAKININLAPGDYIIKTTNPYNNYTIENNITVLSTTIINNMEKYCRNASRYTVKVLDGQGNPLSGENISININGVFYYRTTDEDGFAYLNINLDPNLYIATVYTPYNGLKRSSNVTVLTTIIGQNLTKYFRNNSQLLVKILDNEGNPLVGENISMNINGVFYFKVTNESGFAKLNINLMPNTYIATIRSPSINLEKAFIVEVLPTIKSENLTTYFNSGKSFDVITLDKAGNPLPYQDVSFIFYGRVHNIISDSEGIARLNFNVPSGDYTVSATYDDVTVQHMITVDPGYMTYHSSIGNASSNVRVAFIVGVHPIEHVVHESLLEILPVTENLRYCYDIYQVNVTENPLVYEEGRMNGQLIANKYVVPQINSIPYNLVVDIHSNIGSWERNYFVFAPKTSGYSELYASEIAYNSSELVYFTPPSSTSPEYVTLPIINQNIPAFIYEEYTYATKETVDRHMGDFIYWVDATEIVIF